MWILQYINNGNVKLIFLSSFFSGIFRPGMNAILGPTGSGKSS